MEEKEIRTTLEETKKQYLQSKFPNYMVIPFLHKSEYLGAKLLTIGMNVVICTVWCGRQSTRIHFPIDILTRWYIVLATP